MEGTETTMNNRTSDEMEVLTENKEVAPKKQKRQKIRHKFQAYCKRMEIPYPQVNPREGEHFDTCKVCQETWPVFVFQQGFVQNKSMEDTTIQWVEMTETDRIKQHKLLLKEDAAWLKRIVQNRPPSGYQVYLKEKTQLSPDIKKIKEFKERTKLIASLWADLTDDQKQPYVKESERAKLSKKEMMDTLPPFKRKQIERERRKQLKDVRKKRPPRPANAFMIYLSQRWQDELQKPNHMTRKDMIQIVSKDWKELSAEQKLPFKTQFIDRKTKYFVSKDKLTRQLKKAAEKEQVNAKQQTKPDEKHDDQTDDEQSEDSSTTGDDMEAE